MYGVSLDFINSKDTRTIFSCVKNVEKGLSYE